MPGAHGPPETWLRMGLEVRFKEREKFAVGTVLGVDPDDSLVAIDQKTGAGVIVVSMDNVWQIHESRPTLLQSPRPLFLDRIAQNRTEGSQRRQYAFRSSTVRSTSMNRRGVTGRSNSWGFPSGRDQKKMKLNDAPSICERRRRIVRCVCGWNRIITPLVIRCRTCDCWLHCVCVGVRCPEDMPQGLNTCTFCEWGWPRATQVLPAAPMSPDTNEPYQIPIELIQQRFLPATCPPQRPIFHAIQRAVKDRLAADGFELELLPGGKNGPLDNDAAVQECIEVCSSSVAEGYFDHRYPMNAFSSMRTDSCSRVTLLRDPRTGKAAAVLASSGNDCPLVLKGACRALERAFNDPRMDQYLCTMSIDVLRIFSQIHQFWPFIHLSLVATNSKYRQRGLASLLMLHDLAAWAAEGRTQMYLNMTLLRRTVSVTTKPKNASQPKTETKAVFYYSKPSRMLYEKFGFQLVYPRKPEKGPHPLLPNETGVRCRWTDREVNNGVLMANIDFWGDVYRNFTRLFPDVHIPEIDSVLKSVKTNYIPDPPPLPNLREAARGSLSASPSFGDRMDVDGEEEEGEELEEGTDGYDELEQEESEEMEEEGDLDGGEVEISEADDEIAQIAEMELEVASIDTSNKSDDHHSGTPVR